jgi:hypothetical protein
VLTTPLWRSLRDGLPESELWWLVRPDAAALVAPLAGADRVLVLHMGRLLADGVPDEVARTLGGGTLEEAFLRATWARAQAPGASANLFNIEKDPVRNRAEYLSEWRSDVTGFIPREVVEACVGDYHEHGRWKDCFSMTTDLREGGIAVLDFGAGRGKWSEDPVSLRAKLGDLRGSCRVVVGADTDPALLTDNTLLASLNSTTATRPASSTTPPTESCASCAVSPSWASTSSTRLAPTVRGNSEGSPQGPLETSHSNPPPSIVWTMR